MWHKHYRYFLKFAVVGIAYFTTARFGLTLNAVSGFATLVWAPTGIALAALFILGYRLWPAITLAAFLTNLATGANPLVALGIGVGNTFEPLLGAYVLRRYVRFEPAIGRLKDVSGLILVALLCTMVSATVGVSSLWLGHTVSNNAFGGTWAAWWVGDMLGAIVVASLILVWSQRSIRPVRANILVEAAVYLVVVVSVCAIVFHKESAFTYTYIIFPILIWMALRFGQVGSVTATFVASVAAIWATIAGSHVSGIALSHRLLQLQVFLGVSVVTFMILATLVAERERSLRQQHRLELKAEILAKQRTRLLALSQAKDEFIALASHQLRTPATTIKIYTGMLLENYAGKLTKDQTRMLKTAYDGNEKQLELINTLLRVAKLDAGEIILKKEKVDLAMLINEIIASYKGNFAARQQTVNFLHGKRAFVAEVDKEKVRIVLENLIDNASKYSPPGKAINVKLKRDKKYLAVAVQDKGIGIVKKDMRKLFRKFSRIDNPHSTSVEGTGLGLYWAKKIVSLHRGSIEVTSNPRQGSTFTVVFPK